MSAQGIMNLAKYLYERLQGPLVSANRYLYGEDLPPKLVQNKDGSFRIEVHPGMELYDQAEKLLSPLLSGAIYKVSPPRHAFKDGYQIFSLQKAENSKGSPLFVITHVGSTIHFYDPSQSHIPAPIQLDLIYAFSPGKNGDVYRKLILPLEDPDQLTGMVKLDSYIVRSSDAVPGCLNVYSSKVRETLLYRYGLFQHGSYYMERLLESLDDTDLDRYALYLPNVILDFLYLYPQEVEIFPNVSIWLQSGLRLALPLKAL